MILKTYRDKTYTIQCLIPIFYDKRMDCMEKIMVKTHLKSRDYLPKDVVRIVNQKQVLLYAKNDVYPIDMYTSVDEKTNNTILVMIYLKEDTFDVYKKWCNYELE